MLEKLETTYLAILRAVVIIGSGTLLFCVIVFGLNSLKGLASEPTGELKSIQVSAQDVAKKLTESDKKNVSKDAEQNSSSAMHEVANKQYYDKTAKYVIDFITKNANEPVNLDQNQIIDVIKSRAESFNDTQLTSDFAKGLMQTTETLFADKLTIENAKKNGATNTANNVLNTYTDSFRESLKNEQRRVSEDKEKYQQNKASAAENLYFSAASFGLFILIVFLSIFIKIERSIREISNKNKLLFDKNHAE